MSINKPIPLLDLKAQFTTIESDVRSAIDRVLASQHFILGPEVEALEREIAAYCGAAHGIGVSSGSDALLVALMALDIKPGDEIVTTPFTFFATAGAITRLGARPVFVDIDPETYNLDPLRLEAALSTSTKAIMPVHLYGQCCDMEAVLAIANKHGLPVIEDAAQALGASCPAGAAGSMGTAGCFSFFPSKNLGGFGDGGMVVTNDAQLAEKIKILRAHGAKPKYYHKLVGGNFRLDAIQAAILRAKLPYLDGWSAARAGNADLYNQLFAASGLPDDLLQAPTIKYSRHVLNQYVIRTPARDAVQKALQDAKVGCEIYYPLPLHLQDCFVGITRNAGSLAQSERAAKETLALPIYPELDREQIAQVADIVIAAVKSFAV